MAEEQEYTNQPVDIEEENASTQDVSGDIYTGLEEEKPKPKRKKPASSLAPVILIDWNNSVFGNNGNPIWDILPGESVFWYSVFEDYRRMGQMRDVRKSFQRYADNGMVLKPKTLDRISTDWRWEQRAKAWDLYIIIQERRLEEEDRLKDWKDRIQLLKAARAKATKMLMNLKEEDANWRDAMSLMKMVLDGLRTEYEISNPYKDMPMPVDPSNIANNEPDDELSALIDAAEFARKKLITGNTITPAQPPSFFDMKDSTDKDVDAVVTEIK